MTWPRFLVAAEDEFAETLDWYLERSFRAYTGFRSAVEASAKRLASMPKSFPSIVVPGAPITVRRARTKGFPFVLVFVEHNDQVVVVAVAHTSRRPLYWTNRLTELDEG